MIPDPWPADLTAPARLAPSSSGGRGEREREEGEEGEKKKEE